MGQTLDSLIPCVNYPSQNEPLLSIPLHPPQCLQTAEDHAEMRRLLREDPTVVHQEQESQRFFLSFVTSPLHDTIRRFHKSCMVILLKHNANTNFRDSIGETPMYLAINASEFDDKTGTMVKLLLDNNVSPNYPFENYASTYYLCSAVIRHCNAVVKLLLEYGANTEDDNRNLSSLIDVCYPILHAILHNNSKGIYLLLLHGAKINLSEFCHKVLLTQRILTCYSRASNVIKVLELYRQFGGNLWEKLENHGTGLHELIDLSEDYLYDHDNRMELIARLEEMMATPLSLQSQCRNVIRKSLGRKYWALVYTLQFDGSLLPWSIVQFLLYRELTVGLEKDRAEVE